MNNKLPSYLNEKLNQINQHNSFGMVRLPWDPMVKKSRVTVFQSSVSTFCLKKTKLQN